MKQYKISILLIVGLVFVTLLGVKRFLLPNNAPDGGTSATKAVDSLAKLHETAANQQMAVETLPVPAQPAVSAPGTLPQQAAIEPAPQSDTDDRSQVLSYIEFLSLTENYSIQNGEISWREYRAYRRAGARALHSA